MTRNSNPAETKAPKRMALVSAYGDPETKEYAPPTAAIRSQSNIAVISMARTRRNVAMVLLLIVRRTPEIEEADNKKTSRESANARIPPVPLERRDRRRHAAPP